MPPRKQRRRKRIVILLALVGVIALAGLAAVQVKRHRQASMLVHKRESGMAAHEAGDHLQAIRDLGYVFSQSPQDGEAALAFAQSRRQVATVNGRNLAQAVIAARRAAELMPDDLRPRTLLMSLFGEMGMLTERLQAARDVLALDPQNHDGMWVEVDSLRRLGRRDEALQRAEAIEKVHPDDPLAGKTIVELMLAMQHPEDEVIGFVEQVASDRPDDVHAQLLKARVLGMLDHVDEARRTALAAAQMAQPDAQTLAATIQLLDLLGEDDTVANLLERERSDSASGDMASVVSASRAWKNGRPQIASGIVAKALADPSQASDAMLGWGAFIDHGSQIAADARKELANRTSDEAGAWLAVLDARDAVLAGDWATAQARLRRAAELNRINELTVFLEGEVDRATGDWRAAVDRWRQLRVAEPRWITLRVDIATALLGARQARQAYDEAIQTLSQWPDRMLAALTAGRAGVALIEQKQATDAEQSLIFQILGEIEKQSSPAVIGTALLTRAQAATGDLASARQSLAKILSAKSLPPNDDLIALIHSCGRFGVFGVDELIALAAGERKDQPGVLFAAALAAHAQGRTRQGEAMLTDAIERAGDNERQLATLQRLRAIYLDRVGDAGAAEALESFAQSDRTNPDAQMALLNSKSGWTDPAAISTAIAALRDISGQRGSAWRVYEARRLLTFESGEKAAAKVVTLLDPVVRREPDNAPALILLGDAYATLHDYDQSSQMLGRALDNDSTNVSLYVKLIEILQTAGRADEAQSRLQSFLQVEPVPDAIRRQRAQLLLRQGMSGEAVADLDALAAEGTILEETIAAQAVARTGDAAAAKQRFDTILKRDDLTAQAVLAAADFYAKNISFDDGLALLDKIPTEVADADRAMMKAAFLRRHGRVADAEKAFASIAGDTDLARAWIELARLRLRRGDAAGARKAVQSGIASHPDDVELKKLQVATADAGDSAPVEALSAIADLLEKGDAVRKPLEQFIEALRAIKARPDDSVFAAGQLRRITQEYPTFFPAWRALAQVFSVGGDAEQAAAIAREAASKNPTSAPAAELATRALALAGSFDEALIMAEQWSRLLNDDPYQAEMFRATLEFRLGQNAAALVSLQPWKGRIVHEAPSAPDVLNAYAGLLTQVGRGEEAAALYEPLIAKDPVWAIRRLRLATWLRSQPANMRLWIERWAPALPDTPEARLALGQSWYDLAGAGGGVDALKRVVDILSPLIDAPDQRFGVATLLAGAFEQLDELDQAERYYRIAMKERPDTPLVLNNLAYLIQRKDGSITEAIELAQRAVALADEQGVAQGTLVNFLDTLGVVLLKAERFTDAAAAYDRAAQIEPENVGVLLGLARARLDSDQAPQARKVIAQLTSLRDRGRINRADQRQQLIALIQQSDAVGD